MAEEIPDLSDSYETDNPPPKRGRPASTFPSGKTVQQVADAMPCCTTLIGRWCLGLQVPNKRKNRLYSLVGVADDHEWLQWVTERNNK